MNYSNNNTYLFKGNDTIRDVNDASYLFGLFVARELEKSGMKASYRHVLKPLLENDGLTQLDIVNETGLKAPTISITLRNMEREGIVRREKGKKDRRETHVHITKKGKQMYERVLEAYDKAEQTMLNGIDEKERKKVGEIIGMMKENLEKGLEE